MQSSLYCGSNLLSNCPFLHLHSVPLSVASCSSEMFGQFTLFPLPGDPFPAAQMSHIPLTHEAWLRCDPCPHPLWVSSFDPSPPQMEWTSSFSTYPTLYVSRNDIVYKYLCYAYQTESNDESKLCCFHLCVLRAQHKFWHIVGLPFMFREFERNRQ